MRTFKNLLVVLNEDGLSEAVVSRARQLARAPDVCVTVLSVRDCDKFGFDWLAASLPGRSADDLRARVTKALRAELASASAALARDGATVTEVMADGRAVREIIRQVQVGDHDLVLKGAEPSFDWGTLSGGDLQLLRSCPCPVWILRDGANAQAGRIMAVVDPGPREGTGNGAGSVTGDVTGKVAGDVSGDVSGNSAGDANDDATRDALCQAVLRTATALAAEDAASLDVVSAWTLYDEPLLRSTRTEMRAHEVDVMLEETRRASRTRLDQLTEGVAGGDPASNLPEVNVLHIRGLPADVIAHHAEEQRIDTLVMGTTGRAGPKGPIAGTTAETILSRVNCSVLAVKPDNFVTPERL